MEKRRLGKTEMDVTVLGFGGAELGFENVPQPEADALLNAALDAGLNIIDTAECYFDSEEKIGRALSTRRDDFFLFTKVGHAHNLQGDDWQPAVMRRSIERSLKNLRTDCLDLIQLHSCSAEILRRGDAIELLQRVQQEGKTRFIGYSGDGEDARTAIEMDIFDTLQTSLNIADQEAVTLTIPQAREKNMGVICKRPLANVAWRYGDDEPEETYHTEYWKRLRVLDYDFLAQGDAAKIALQFTLNVPGVGTAIAGTANPKRWAQNAAMLQGDALSPQQFEAIRARWNEVGSDWKGQV